LGYNGYSKESCFIGGVKYCTTTNLLKHSKMLIEKDFVLGDSKLNTYGFRLLTSGYQIEEFKKNPIGYYMHLRDNGVLVRWNNLRIEGDKIIGQPDINMNNARGKQTSDEINSGFLNAASVGHIVVLESSDDPTLKVQDQTGPTITKWYNRECSLVDIPANNDALVLFDKNNNPINLASFSKSNIALSSTYEDQNKNIDVDAELNHALTQNDITPGMAKQLKNEFGHDPKALKAKLDTYKGGRVKYLIGLTYDELDKQGLMQELKESDFAAYRKKFFLQFGKEPKEQVEINKRNVLTADDLKKKENLLIANGRWNQSGIATWKAGMKGDMEAYNEWLDKQLIIDEVDYSDKDWDELEKNDALAELKENHYSLFKQKFKEKFGVDYKEGKKGGGKTPELSAHALPVLSQADITATWDMLDRQGKLENLKAINFDLFKLKFKQEFGVDYKKQ
jgi:hypothetical protein